jgi:hypothetical protein
MEAERVRGSNISLWTSLVYDRPQYMVPPNVKVLQRSALGGGANGSISRIGGMGIGGVHHQAIKKGAQIFRFLRPVSSCRG